MPDRRADDETRKRLGAIALGYEKLDRRVSRYLRLFVVLFFVAAVVFTWQESQIGDRADEARDLGRQNRALLSELRGQRTSSRLITCNSQNTFADGHNALVHALENIVRSSSQQSRAFESAYRKLGLPPYRERAKRAQAYIETLNRRLIERLDCKRYVSKPYSIKVRR